MKARAEFVRQWLVETTQRLDWLALLLVRLTAGVVFLESGWGKLHNLAKVVAFFTSLGLPAPEFQARLVASTEFFGGLLVLVGLFARVASVPLMVTMLVAIITAKVDELKSWGDLFGFNEYAYLSLLLVVVAMGPGALSLDALMVRLGKLQAPTKPLERAVLLASRALAYGGAAVLVLFTLWAAGASHNPCKRLGAGEFPDIVKASQGSGDDADEAWRTCKQIQEWKKEGKDPQKELKKQADEGT